MFHRLIQEGHPTFTHALLSVGVGKMLNVQSFKDRTTSIAMEQQGFIRQYARFVEERAAFFRETNIRQLSSGFGIERMIEMMSSGNRSSLSYSDSFSRSQSRDTDHERDLHSANDDGDDDDDDNDGGSRGSPSPQRRRSNARISHNDLFFLIESLQDLMAELLQIQDSLRTPVVQQPCTASAFSLLLQDSRSIFRMQTVAVMALLDTYFTLPPDEAMAGYNLFKRNKKQTDSLLELYDFARECRVIKASLIPKLSPQPDSLLESIKIFAETGEAPSGAITSNENDEHSLDSEVPTSDLREILSEQEINMLNNPSAALPASKDDLLFTDDVQPNSHTSSSSSTPARTTLQAADELFGVAQSNPFGVNDGSNFQQAAHQQHPGTFQPMHNMGVPGMYGGGGYMYGHNNPYMANPYHANAFGHPPSMVPHATGSFYGTASPGMQYGGIQQQQQTGFQPRPSSMFQPPVANNATDHTAGRTSITGKRPITSDKDTKDSTGPSDPFDDLFSF